MKKHKKGWGSKICLNHQLEKHIKLFQSKPKENMIRKKNCICTYPDMNEVRKKKISSKLGKTLWKEVDKIVDRS